MQPMPRDCICAAGCELGGRLFVAGGETKDSHPAAVASVHAYDPVEDRWQPAAPMKTPRLWFRLVTTAGSFF